MPNVSISGFKHYRLRPLRPLFEPYVHSEAFSHPVPSNFARPTHGVRAIIFSHPDGRPVRRPKGRGGKTPRGKFPSFKTRRAQPFESLPERKLIHICEADADVVGYFMQPHRLEMRVIGLERPLVYFPDAVRLMADGRVQVVEAKSFDIDDPEYQRKLDLAEEVYTARGWSFHVETNHRHFDKGLVLKNAKSITDDRDVLLDSADWLNLYRHMDQSAGRSSYGAVARALLRNPDEPDFLGRAKVHKMIIRRALHVALDRRLRDDSNIIFLGADSPSKTLDLQRAWLKRAVDASEGLTWRAEAA